MFWGGRTTNPQYHQSNSAPRCQRKNSLPVPKEVVRDGHFVTRIVSSNDWLSECSNPRLFLPSWRSGAIYAVWEMETARTMANQPFATSDPLLCGAAVRIAVEAFRMSQNQRLHSPFFLNSGGRWTLHKLRVVPTINPNDSDYLKTLLPRMHLQMRLDGPQRVPR